MYRYAERSVSPTCRAEKFAYVMWRLKGPATAKLQYFAVNLGVQQGAKPSMLHRCCKGSTIDRAGDPTHFRARVKATGWRAKDVYRIDMSYWYPNPR